MGCGCSSARGRRSANAKAVGAPLPGTSHAYKVTLPADQDGKSATATYLTPLEAKARVRRAGGGTVKRILVNAAGDELEQVTDSPTGATVTAS